jgi:hypothetical protein
MRFTRFLVEDSISSALGIEEPQVGGKYTTSGVKKKLELLKQAISELGKKEHTDANDAKMADLEDKAEKWSNVDSETEPAETQDTRPGGGEEAPPEEGDPEAEADAEADDQAKEKEGADKDKEDEEKKKKKKKEQEDTQEGRLIKSKIRNLLK